MSYFASKSSYSNTFLVSAFTDNFSKILLYDGVKILVLNIIRQAMKAKSKAGKHKRNQDRLWKLAQAMNKIIQTSSGS